MKTIKVFYQGKQLRDVYPHATPWQVFKYRVTKFFIKVTKVAGFVAVIALSGWIGATYYPKVVLATQEVHVNTLPEKLDELKMDVVLRLEACESGGTSEPEALITYDPGKTTKKDNIASLGSLQFKVPTIQHYVNKLDGKLISKVEAIDIATNREASRQLAKRIIFEEQGGVFNWLNCSNKLDLKGEVEVIKKLSQ